MLNRIVNTFSAFLLLVSSTGMTVNMHFCMDRLYAVGINSPAKNCCNRGDTCMGSCKNDSGDRCRHGFLVGAPGHCSNRTVHAGNTDDYVVSPNSVDVAAFVQQFSTPGIPATQSILSPLEFHARRTAYKYCKPPPLIKADLSAFQSYLI